MAYRSSLVAQRLKRLPAKWETWVRSLGQEDPLEKEMTTHSTILAWRIPGMGKPGGLLSMGSHRVGHPLEKGMAIYSIILAWRIPWTEESGRLQKVAT